MAASYTTLAEAWCGQPERQVPEKLGEHLLGALTYSPPRQQPILRPEARTDSLMLGEL